MECKVLEIFRVEKCGGSYVVVDCAVPMGDAMTLNGKRVEQWYQRSATVFVLRLSDADYDDIFSCDIKSVQIG
jgi:hypothetical protein